MKNTNLGTIVMLITGIALSIFLTVNILTGGANAILSFTKHLTWIFFILGWIGKKKSLYFLVFLGAYFNLVKRMMSYDVMESMALLYSNAPPATLLLGVVARVFFDRLLRGSGGELKKLMLFVPPIIFFMLIFLKSKAGGSELGTSLNNSVNGAAYTFIIPVILLEFKSYKEIVGLAKFSVLAFIPVALYGIRQQFFGWTDFDVAYMSSGWTMIIYSGYEDDVVRAFSTVQSSAAFGTSCLACLFLTFIWLGSKNNWRINLLNPVVVLVATIFITAIISSLARNVYVGLIASAVIFFVIKRKKIAMICYACIPMTYVMMVVFSGPILEFYTDNYQSFSDPTGSDTLNRVFAVHTLSDRFIGLNNVRTNPDLVGPFGASVATNIDGEESDMALSREANLSLRRSNLFTHDGFSTLLVTVGYIPCFLLVVVLLFLANKIHNKLHFNKGTASGFCAHVCLALSVGGIVTLFGSTRTLAQFPGNLMFFIVVGIAIYAIRNPNEHSISDSR